MVVSPYHSSQRVYNKHITIGCSFGCSQRENCMHSFTQTVKQGGRGVLRGYVQQTGHSESELHKFAFARKGYWKFSAVSGEGSAETTCGRSGGARR